MPKNHIFSNYRGGGEGRGGVHAGCVPWIRPCKVRFKVETLAEKILNTDQDKVKIKFVNIFFFFRSLLKWVICKFLFLSMSGKNILYVECLKFMQVRGLSPYVGHLSCACWLFDFLLKYHYLTVINKISDKKYLKSKKHLFNE